MDSMTHSAGPITGGVDTHGQVHVAAAICSVTHRLLGVASFPVTVAGYVQLLGWLAGFGEVERVGVEGTGAYGAGLARFLTAEGIKVVEVDRPDRSERRRRGKSDPIDAEAAARAVLAGRASGTPKTRDGLVEAIRAWWVVYRSAVKDRTATTNRFHALTVTAPAELRTELEQIAKDRRVATVARWRTRTGDDVVTAATRAALVELARRIGHLDDQAERAYQQLDLLTDRCAPALRDLHGVGVCVAAQLLVTIGDNPDRLHSDAAFAHLCGVAPIPASSGKTTRHRLNQGGDRAANHALCIVMVRRSHHEPRTTDYFNRRRAEGLDDRDIMRCLKRYIAREVYAAITNPAALAPRGAQLRQQREQTGLPLRIVAEAHDISFGYLARLERGEVRNPDLQTAIHTWLTTPAHQPAAA